MAWFVGADPCVCPAIGRTHRCAPTNSVQPIATRYSFINGSAALLPASGGAGRYRQRRPFTQGRHESVKRFYKWDGKQKQQAT